MTVIDQNEEDRNDDEDAGDAEKHHRHNSLREFPAEREEEDDGDDDEGDGERRCVEDLLIWSVLDCDVLDIRTFPENDGANGGRQIDDHNQAIGGSEPAQIYAGHDDGCRWQRVNKNPAKMETFWTMPLDVGWVLQSWVGE